MRVVCQWHFNQDNVVRHMNTDPLNENLNCDLDSSGYWDNLIPNGYYHASVDGVAKDQLGGTPAIKLTFIIFAGTVPGQTNRTLIEWVFLTEKTKQRQLFF